MTSTTITLEQAALIGKQLHLTRDRFDVEQLRQGMQVELEHGTRDPETNVTNNDLLLTGKIALAHLREFPDYYTRLAQMEQEAKLYRTQHAD